MAYLMSPFQLPHVPVFVFSGYRISRQQCNCIPDALAVTPEQIPPNVTLSDDDPFLMARLAAASSRSPARGEQLTFLDRRSYRHGQARRRSASFVWCVSSYFSCGFLQHSDLGWSVCLPTTLCCLLVCHCMLRAGRVDADEGLEQVHRGCMFNAGRSVVALCNLMPSSGSGK